MTQVPEIITITEAAKILRVKPQTLYNWKCTRYHGADFFIEMAGLKVDAERMRAWIESRRLK